MTIKCRISKDIRDEKAAKRGYDSLAKTVRKTMGKAAANTIKHIAREERQHKSMLETLKRQAGKKK